MSTGPKFTHEVQIRSGVLINDDPQRRCYNGCYFASHMEWGPWRHWTNCTNKDDADRQVRLFKREDQQLRVNPGQPNRKAMKKLNRRIADWAITDAKTNIEPGSYHKPGSMQLR